MRTSFLIATSLLSVLLGIPSNSQEKSPSGDKPANRPVNSSTVQKETYRLQPGDEISVTVDPQKNFNTEATVLPDGKLYLRIVGEVDAAGLTVREVQQLVVKQLLKRGLRAPDVTVTVKRGATAIPRVTVGGAVGHPGPLDLEEGLRLRRALELAGGANRDADLTRVVLLHSDLTRQVVDISTPERVQDPAFNVLLKGGDSVEVLSLGKVTVIGLVEKGGIFDLEPNLRVSRVLDLAGGPTKDADLKHVLLVHRDLNRETLDLTSKESQLDPNVNRLLRDGDTISVPTGLKQGFVVITGEVNEGGTFELKPGMGVEDLIQAAHKLTFVADAEHIQLQRPGKPARIINLYERLAKGAEDKVYLEPGDTVLVPAQKATVMVLAPIEKPGPRPLKPGQTIRDLIFDPQSGIALNPALVDLKHVEIIRAAEPRKKVDLTKALRSPRSKDDPELKPGDVVMLPSKDYGGNNRWGFLSSLSFLGAFTPLF